MLYTAVTTRPCSKDIAHGPDAIKADLFESIEENPSPPYNAPRSLFPDFFLFFFLFFLSIESMNFETRIRAYLPIIANFFLIFQLREGDILSEHSFSSPSRRRNVVSFLSSNRRTCEQRWNSDGYLEVDIDFETKAKQVASYRVDDLL